MRSYKGFASNDGKNWLDLGTVSASGSAQALTRLHEDDRGGHLQYRVTPERNWIGGTVEVVQRAPVVRFAKVPDEQMKIEDVLRVAEQEGVIPGQETGQDAPEETSRRVIG